MLGSVKIKTTMRDVTDITAVILPARLLVDIARINEMTSKDGKCSKR